MDDKIHAAYRERFPEPTPEALFRGGWFAAIEHLRIMPKPFVKDAWEAYAIQPARFRINFDTLDWYLLYFVDGWEAALDAPQEVFGDTA